MALERMSVEVWQTILRYSISVPVFFDTDAIESNGFEEYTKRYDDDWIYWRSERHRNILRRVCSGWNFYLLRFNHRFVQLEDIWRDLIPATSLKQAIKLRYKTLVPPFTNHAFKVVQQALIEDEGWALEILDGGLHHIDELILQSDKVPNLEGIYLRDMKLPNIALWRPNIRLLDTTLKNKSTYEPLRLPQLTALSILSPLVGVIACDFPSLKHLSIYSSWSEKLHPQELVKLLEITGKNLVTFLDHHAFSKERLPREIWALCPNLKRFQTSLALEVDAYIPSSLDTFQFSSGLFNSKMYMDPSRLPLDCLRRAGVTKVTFRDPWKIGLTMYLEGFPECILHILDNGFSFYDIGGIKFQDMIVSLLQFRKAEKCLPFPSWNRRIRWF